MKKSEVILMLLAHLGPMTSREIWECLWGEERMNRELSKRIFGWYPDILDYQLSALREKGYIISIGQSGAGRAYTWRAV